MNYLALHLISRIRRSLFVNLFLTNDKIHLQEAIITVNHVIKLIFIGLERVRLKGRERMLHSFRREDENLKFDIIFQAKLFTMCLYFCVSVFVSLCRAMQIIIQRCVVRQMVFQVFSVPNKKNHSRSSNQ